MIAVIGDIHGCYFTLRELYEKIKKKYPDIEIYQTGDAIDRGAFSREAVSFIIDNNIKQVLGNHEQMAIDYFKNPNSIFAKAWVYNGSLQTLYSYKNYPEVLIKHIEYFQNLPLYYNLSDCFISHAGISKEFVDKFDLSFLNDDSQLKEFAERIKLDEEGILWARDRLINIGKLQVVGHTRMSEPYYDKSSNALYIDTGAIGGNMLSCAIIEDNKILEFISLKVIEDDLNSL